MSDDTIKNYAYEYLKIQKGQRGKANKYFCLKKWNDDISYVVKGGDIIASQGFDPLVIAQKTVEGRERFVNVILSKSDRNSQDTNKEVVVTTKAKPQSEWEILYDNSQFLTENNCFSSDKTTKQWKSWIVYQYIKKERAIPRTGDINRYASTLYILHNSKGATRENLAQTLCDNYVDEIEQPK